MPCGVAEFEFQFESSPFLSSPLCRTRQRSRPDRRDAAEAGGHGGGAARCTEGRGSGGAGARVLGGHAAAAGPRRPLLRRRGPRARAPRQACELVLTRPLPPSFLFGSLVGPRACADYWARLHFS